VTSTRILFLSGKASDQDALVIQQLTALRPPVHIATLAHAADALTRIHEDATLDLLIISHTVPQLETLATMSALRKAAAPVAIVPVVTETQRDLYSSAMAVGADEVLILLSGTLVHPAETLTRAKTSRRRQQPAVDAARAPTERSAAPGPATPAVTPAPSAAPVVNAEGFRESTSGGASPSARPVPAGVRPGHLEDEEAKRQIREAARDELEASMTAATAGLRRAAAAHAADRTTWERIHEELQARLNKLEAALSATTVELQQAVAAHEADRLGWDARRQEFGIRIAELESLAGPAAALETALNAANAELDRARAVHADERAVWDATREDLERRVHDLESAAGSRDEALDNLRRVHGETEAALAAARADLERSVVEYASDRLAWERERDELSARLLDAESACADLRHLIAADRQTLAATQEDLDRRSADVEAGIRKQSELEVSLNTTHAELEQMKERQAGDREDWDRRRRDLEARLEAEKTDELGRMSGQYSADRQAWDAERQDFARRTNELEAILQTHVEAGAERQAALDAAKAHVERLTEAHGAERTARDSDRSFHEQALRSEQEARANDRAEHLAFRTVLEQRLRDAESAQAGLVLALEDARAEIARQITQMAPLEARLDDSRDALARLAHDLREATAARDRLAAQQDRLLRTGVVGYGITTVSGRLIRCNDAFAELIGFDDASDAVNRDAMFSTDADQKLQDDGPIVTGRVVFGEPCIRRADGRQIRLSEAATLAPGTDGGDVVIERVVLDLSERANLEARARRAGRLEEAGQLAATIAPDVETLSTLLDRAVSLLKGETSQTDRAELAENLSVCAADAIPQLRQLLGFSRKQARPPETIDLASAVEESAFVLRRLVGTHIDFRTQSGVSGLITVDEADFDQMLTALFVAGRDLLSAGGSLTVETGRAAVESGSLSGTHRIHPDAVVSVTASGRGVQFTPVSPTLEAVVARCGGVLEMSGEPGKRTVLRVRFPHCGG
jgi:hypothetical protein